MEPLQKRKKWVIFLLLVGVFSSFSSTGSIHRSWIKAVEFYYLLHDQRSFEGDHHLLGAYSPLAYILIQVLQVVVAPIPGGLIEFIGGYLFGVEPVFSIR